MSPRITRRRKWILSGALALTCILVWWAQMYEPFQERLADVRDDIDVYTAERDQLTGQIQKLTGLIGTNPVNATEQARYQQVKIDGKKIEEVNAVVQSMLQQFMEQKGLAIKTYKELPPGKWQEYPVGRIEVQFETNMQGLSDTLEYFESLNRLVRIERLTINYRRTKQSDLLISMQIGILLLEEVRP